MSGPRQTRGQSNADLRHPWEAHVQALQTYGRPMDDPWAIYVICATSITPRATHERATHEDRTLNALTTHGLRPMGQHYGIVMYGRPRGGPWTPVLQIHARPTGQYKTISWVTDGSPVGDVTSLVVLAHESSIIL